jgi:hypothetical protein
MIDQDEARELAARERHAEVSDIEIEEFDLGYVAWRRQPPRPDPTIPPSTVGGTVLVVDKETGEITSWPTIGSTGVIKLFRSHKLGEGTGL